MVFHKSSGESEQVGYNLLAQRTQQLSNLGMRASNSYLHGKVDDYFYTLISLRQQLTPNLNPRERRILNRIEKEINILKSKSLVQEKEEDRDDPGYALKVRFQKNRKSFAPINNKALYVEKIKKFEQALLIVMKKKGFYPGKADASGIGGI